MYKLSGVLKINPIKQLIAFAGVKCTTKVTSKQYQVSMRQNVYNDYIGFLFF